MMSCSVIGVFEFWMSSLKFLLSVVSTIPVLIRPYCCHLCIASVLFPITVGYLPSRLQAQGSLLSIVFLLLFAQSGACFLPSFFAKIPLCILVPPRIDRYYACLSCTNTSCLVLLRIMAGYRATLLVRRPLPSLMAGRSPIEWGSISLIL